MITVYFQHFVKIFSGIIPAQLLQHTVIDPLDPFAPGLAGLLYILQCLFPVIEIIEIFIEHASQVLCQLRFKIPHVRLLIEPGIL